MLTPRYRQLFTVAAVVVLSIGIVSACRHAETSQCIGIDFVQFRIAGQHLRRGGSADLYDPAIRQKILESAWTRAQRNPSIRYLAALEFRHTRSLELYSSPFLYALFSIAPDASYEASLTTCQFFSIAATVIGCLGFGSALGISRIAMIVGGLALAMYGPLRVDLQVVNVNQLQFGMLGTALLLQRTMPHSASDAIVAFWLGLCMAFKPSLIWCVVLVTADAAIRRDGRRIRQSAAGCLAGVFAAGLIASPWFTLREWVDWIAAVRSMPMDIIQTQQGNYSPTCFAVETGGAPDALYSVSGFIVAGLVIIGAKKSLRTRRRTIAQPNPALESLCDMHTLATHGGRQKASNAGQRRDAIHLSIGCLIFLETSRLVWGHYFVLSLPAVLVVLSESVRMKNPLQRGLLFAVACWALLLLGITHIDRWIGSGPEEHSIRCALANVMLTVVCVTALRSVGPTAVATQMQSQAGD